MKKALIFITVLIMVDLVYERLNSSSGTLVENDSFLNSFIDTPRNFFGNLQNEFYRSFVVITFLSGHKSVFL